MMTVSVYFDDCIRFIEVVFEQCDTKEQFCNNEYRETILEAIFGETDKCWSDLNALTDDCTFFEIISNMLKCSYLHALPFNIAYVWMTLKF